MLDQTLAQLMQRILEREAISTPVGTSSWDKPSHATDHTIRRCLNRHVKHVLLYIGKTSCQYIQGGSFPPGDILNINLPGRAVSHQISQFPVGQGGRTGWRNPIQRLQESDLRELRLAPPQGRLSNTA